MEMQLVLAIAVCGDAGPFAALRRHAEGVIPLTALKARSKVVKSRKPHANAMSVIVHALIRSSPSMMEPLSSLVLTIHCATVAPFFWKIRCSIRIEIPSCRASVAGWKSGSCALRAMILQAVSNTPARSDVDVETRIGSSQSIAKISSVKLSTTRAAGYEERRSACADVVEAGLEPKRHDVRAAGNRHIPGAHVGDSLSTLDTGHSIRMKDCGVALVPLASDFVACSFADVS
jgi:hypothetical protein